MSEKLRALILGDVVGQSGCRALFVGLPSLIRKADADLVVVNGENAHEGFGMTPSIMQNLFQSGADVITSGNHIWQNREILPYLQTEDRLLRPENYPLGVVGKGYCALNVKGTPVLVLNLEGRVNLSSLRCPFEVGRSLIKRYRRDIKIVIIDFHAEWPEEKEALSLYLDGEVSALVGTHTHVQTADERILPKGTAYITDIGMTGPMNSVIGMKRETAIQRSLSQMPLKMEVDSAPAEIMGVIVDVDTRAGKALGIQRIREKSPV